MLLCYYVFMNIMSFMNIKNIMNIMFFNGDFFNLNI